MKAPSTSHLSSRKWPNQSFCARYSSMAFPHAVRHRDLVVEGDDLLGTLDHPRQNALTGVVVEVLAVVLDVGLALDLGVERDHDEPAPDAVVGGGDAGQVVRVQDQRVAGLEGEGVFVLLLREHVVGGTELLDRGVVQACAFLHLSSDQQALPLDLGHLGLDVPATSDGQGVCGDVAAVEPQHAGYGVPEGGLAVAPVAVGDDERLHVDLPDGGEAADHLHVVDELPIPLEDQVQVVQPELPALVAGRDRGDLRDEVVGRVLAGTGRPFRRS